MIFFEVFPAFGFMVALICFMFIASNRHDKDYEDAIFDVFFISIGWSLGDLVIHLISN